MAHPIEADLSNKSGIDLGPHVERRPEPARAKRGHYDLKKWLLIAGLAALSWISTFVGMLELIEANLGELDLVFKLAVAGSVAMLMLMVVWLLDQMFNRDNAGSVRVLYFAGYLFLTLISIGFSFGFYWKFLESRTEGTKIAEQAVVGVQTQLQAAETRLTQLQTTLESLALISTQKAEAERVSGNSCPNSRPGDGPRRRLREADAASFATASQFVKDRAALIKKDIASFGTDLEKIVKQDKSTFDPKTGTRTDFLKGVTRKLTMTVSGYEAFRSDPQLRQFRADFGDRAEKTVFPDEQGKTFTCPDAQIQSALRGGVKAIDALPQITAPEIVTVEGADATLEAFRRLIYTLTTPAALFSSRSGEDIRAAQQRAMQSLGNQGGEQVMPHIQEGLGKRDYIPLTIAIFVDLCLLLVSIPQATSAAQQARQRRANATGETYRTLDDLYAIHDDEDTRGRLEPLRHIAFDWLGVDYVAVPVVAGVEALRRESRKRSTFDLSSLIFTRIDEPEELPGDGDSMPSEEVEAKLAQDLKEAQFLANFFASHENKGPYRRAVFPRTATIKRRLAKIGSKWANLDTFRLYRFKRGAWSDFVLDVVVGADRELGPVRETQKRTALRRTQLKSDQLLHASEINTEQHKSQIAMMRKESEIKQRGAEQALQEMEQQLRARDIDLRKKELESERDVKKLEHELRQMDADNDTGEEIYSDGRREPWLSLNRLRGTKKVRPTQPERPAEPSPEITALLKGVSQLTLAMHHQQQQMADLMRAQQNVMHVNGYHQHGVPPFHVPPVNGHGHGAYGAQGTTGRTSTDHSAMGHAASHAMNGATHLHPPTMAGSDQGQWHGSNGYAHPQHGVPPAGGAVAQAIPAQPPVQQYAQHPTIARTAADAPAVIPLHSDRRPHEQQQPLHGQVLPPLLDGNAALSRQAESDPTPATKSEARGFGKLLKTGLGGLSDLFKRAPQSQAPQGGVRNLDHEPIEPLVADAVTVDTGAAYGQAPHAGTEPLSERHVRPMTPPQAPAPAPSLLSTREELDRFIRELEENTSRVAARVASPYPAASEAAAKPVHEPVRPAVVAATAQPEVWQETELDLEPHDFGFDSSRPLDELEPHRDHTGFQPERAAAPRRSHDHGGARTRMEPHFEEPDPDDAELEEIYGDASDKIAIGDITKWYGKGRKKSDRRH